MVSFIETEKCFQNILQRLQLEYTPRLQISLILSFLDKLPETTSLYLFQSYYIELIPYFKKCFHPIALINRSQKELLLLEKHLRAMASVGILKYGILQNFSSNLIGAQILSNLYIRDWKALVKIITQVKTDTVLSIDKPTQNMMKKAENLLHQVSPFEEQTYLSLLHGIEEIYSGSFIADDNSVQVLLVKKHYDKNYPIASGCLTHISCTIDPLTDCAKKDVIIINNKNLMSDDMFFTQIYDAFQWAKNEVLGKVLCNKTFYYVTYNIAIREGYLTGNSLGIAHALISFSALSKKNNVRYTYSLNPNIAFTGSMDNKGYISRISQETINEKITAIFFSPATDVVIPSDNLHAGQEALATLNKNYPNRTLNIISVSHMNDCINNPRIITKKLKQHHTLKKFRKFYIYLFVFLLLAFLTLIFFFLRNNSVGVTAIKNTFHLLNMC